MTSIMAPRMTRVSILFDNSMANGDDVRVRLESLSAFSGVKRPPGPGGEVRDISTGNLIQTTYDVPRASRAGVVTAVRAAHGCALAGDLYAQRTPLQEFTERTWSEDSPEDYLL